MAGARIIAGVRNCIDTGQLQCLTIGPSLTISLSDGDRAASWQLDVEVELEGTGSFRLGSVITTASAVRPPAARIVGVAFCPGAIRWRVFASRVAGAARAVGDIDLSMSACCPAFVGLLPVYPFSSPATSVVDSPAAVAVGVVATRLEAVDLPMRSLVVQADVANTDPIWIGGPSVTIGTGIELAPGQNESIDVERADLVWAIAGVVGQVARVQVVR